MFKFTFKQQPDRLLAAWLALVLVLALAPTNAVAQIRAGLISLTSMVSGILPGANGGSGNGFFAVSGPASTLKTFAFPNASATVLTSNAAVTAAQGGTGQTTPTADATFVGDGSGFNLKVLPSCSDSSTSKLLYNSTTDAFSCGTDAGSAGGGAPDNAEYWTAAASGGLSAEKNLGALTTALVLNTSGTPSAYAGSTCTNQFMRILSAVGVATCASVDLSADVTSTLPLTSVGGTIPPQGRLTLTTATPFMVSSVTAATTVYYTPAIGNVLPLYNGSTWTLNTFAELSQATTDTTKSPAAAAAYSNYDVFGWIDSGTVRATRGPAWSVAQTFTVTIASPAVFSLTAHGFYEGMPLVFSTSGALPTGLTAGTTYFVITAGLTANAFEVSTSVGGAAVNTTGSQSGTQTATQNTTLRGTGAGTTELEYVNGILMNKNAITNGPSADRGVYLGSFRTNASSQVDMIFGGTGAAGGENSVIGIWNMYNRRTVTIQDLDNSDSWTYTTSTFRLKNLAASTTGNRILFLTGWQGDGFAAYVNTWASNSTANIAAQGAVGFNGTIAPATNGVSSVHRMAINLAASGTGWLAQQAPLGFNYVAALETSSATGTQTWSGDGGNTYFLSGFHMSATF